VAQAGTAGTYGTFAIGTDGKWTYTASSAHHEFVDGTTYTDSFDVFSADGTKTSVVIHILGTNDPATAAADTATTPEETPVTIDVLANDSDVDGPSLNIKSATVPPEQGTVAIVNGKLVFTPAKDFNGTATITYVASDGALDTEPTVVTVIVTPVVDPVTVSSPTVNEASPYAVFTVTGGIGETVALELGAGSASGGGADFGTSSATQLEVSTDGGRTWTPYSAASTFPVDGKLLARTSVKQDSVYEGTETFTLKATPTGGTAAAGTATIRDDGNGTIYNADGSENTAARKDDDRPISIADVTVNEASPYAVFRIEASGGQQFTLSLRDGPTNSDSSVSTATAGADYRNSLETYDGVKWIPYTPGSLVSVPSGGSVLLVRVPLVDDSEYEGAHAFTLVTTMPGAAPVTANGIIGDFGTGAIFNDSGAEDRLAPKNDDRGIKIDSPIVNEGSDFVVFTVKGPAGPVGLLMPVSYETDEPIATGVDKSSSNIQFWEDGGWKTYDGSNASIPSGETLLVRVGIGGEHDQVKEGSEHFAFIVSRDGQDSVGEASVRDDGTGVIYQFASKGSFAGTTTSGLDDDFDQDGITPTTEEALATLAASQGIGDAQSGDLNGDGLQDADQNALATLAWTSKEYFTEGNQGTLTDSKAIISIEVAADASSRTVSSTSQLLDIQVAKYKEIDAATQVVEQAGSKTVTLADGVTQVSTPWDPIRFAISGQDLNNDGQIDTALSDVSDRPGTQVRILIDIRAAGLTTKDVNGYIKYVAQEAIDAAGGQLLDLDGQPITKAGWYDFTQRKAGGDGARFIDENGDGKIDFIELTITDNAFGDNDPRAGSVFDPGAPVLINRPEPVAQHRLREELPYTPPRGEIQFTEGPRFEHLPFDSTLYALAAEANPKALGLIERTTWSWMPSPDRDWAHDRYPDPATAEPGWTPVIVPAEVTSLKVLRGMPDQFAMRGSTSSFAVPSDAFAHSQADAQVELRAERADGSALPSWLDFDAAAGVFRCSPPENLREELRIRLTARDTQGREAATLFRFHVGDKPRTGGRSGLSEQLRQAAQQKLLQRQPAAAAREGGQSRAVVARP
jgi:VCBS repeat-containing protein